MANYFRKGSAKLMQKLNTSLVLEVIQEQGPISRSELARLTNLSNPAVSALILPLLEDGIVKEIGTASSTGGRPARLLQFNAKAGYLVGVDVGGTKMAGAVVDLAGNIMHRQSCGSAKGIESVEILISLIQDLMRLSDFPPEDFRGIGIGIPGVTDANGQKVSFAPGIGWENLDIGGLVGERFGVPVFVDNDVNCFARGELWRGSLKGVTNGVAVTIGTGIGVGLVLNEQVYKGTHSAAGEVGYWLLGALGPIKKASGFGPLESIAAGPGIAAQAIEQLRKDSSIGQVLRRLVDQNIDQITAKDVFEAALMGDSYCQSIVDQTTKYLGILMANMASLLDVEKIVIGGGLSKAGNQLVVPIRDIVEKLSPYPPKIEISQLQEDGAILGSVSGVLGLRETSIHFSQVNWDDC